jgi:hypothetical protein
MHDAVSERMKLILLIVFLAMVPALVDQLSSAPRDAEVNVLASLQPRNASAPAPLTDQQRELLCGG